MALSLRFDEYCSFWENSKLFYHKKFAVKITALERLKKDLESYRLDYTNAAASWSKQYAKKRIELCLKQIATAEAGDKNYTIAGIKVLENITAQRIQLFFDGKPSDEVITLLRKRGFKWSPTNNCWQRQLTDNARLITNILLRQQTANYQIFRQKLHEVYKLNPPKNLPSYYTPTVMADQVMEKLCNKLVKIGERVTKVCEELGVAPDLEAIAEYLASI